MAISNDEKARLGQKVVEKTCICHHLGNGALIDLEIAREKDSPQAICPGPNIAWFNRFYTLKEMVDHIYGRGPSLISPQRPHMFAKEIVMNVDYFEKLIKNCSYTRKEVKTLKEFKNNLEAGMELCLEIALKPQHQGENLVSITTCVAQQRVRLQSIYNGLTKSISI